MTETARSTRSKSSSAARKNKTLEGSHKNKDIEPTKNINPRFLLMDWRNLVLAMMETPERLEKLGHLVKPT